MKNDRIDSWAEDRPQVQAIMLDAGQEKGFAGSISDEALQPEELAGYHFPARLKSRNGLPELSGRGLLESPELPVFQENLQDAWFASYNGAASMRGIPENIIGDDDRVQVTDTTPYPWRAICSLVIEKNGLYYVGSGSLVGPRTILTAGHNLFIYETGTSNPLGWADSITVIPGRNGGGTPPFGSCVVTGSALRSVQGWTRDKDSDFDWGAIILPENCRFGDQLGYFGYAAPSDANIMNKFLNLSGYPADKGGSTQWYHGRFPHSVNEAHINYEIDTFGGHSGSPVWYKDDTGRYIVGIHTYGGPVTNSANRITNSLFQLIGSWKQQGA